MLKNARRPAADRSLLVGWAFAWEALASAGILLSLR
jgi:hypothetical protein